MTLLVLIMILWYNSHIFLTVFQFLFIVFIKSVCEVVYPSIPISCHLWWVRQLCHCWSEGCVENGWLVLSQNLCAVIIFHIIHCRRCFCHLSVFPNWRCMSCCWFKHSTPFSIAYVCMHVMCHFMAQWWQEVTRDCCWIK